MPPLTVFRAGALGDFVVTLPALYALQEALGPVRFVGNASAASLAAELFAGVRSIDDLAWTGLFSDDAPLSAPPGDAVVMMRDPSVGARLSAAGWRVLAEGHPFPRAAGRHVAEHLLALVAPLVGDGLAAPARWRQRRTIAAPGPPADVPTRYAVVHPGSGSPRKNWPAGRFASVLEAVAAREIEPVLVAGPADGDAASDLLDLYRRPVRLCRGLSLPELAGLLGGAALYVGNDSGVSHLAGAVGAPSVVLFGPTRAARWKPWGPRVQAIEPPDRCALCAAAEERPVGCRCIEQIQPETVIAAAETLLDRVPA